LRQPEGLRIRAIEIRQSNFKMTDPGCNGNEFWNKIGYNSAYIRDNRKKL